VNTRREARRRREGWYQEKQCAWLYSAIAGYEQNPRRQEMFQKLAEQAEVQSQVWETLLSADGSPPPSFRPSLRARFVATLTWLLGPRALRSALVSLKVRGLSAYSDASLAAHHPMPAVAGDAGRRHRGLAGGNLRAAVFGASMTACSRKLV
jgi:hypothetical protein